MLHWSILNAIIPFRNRIVDLEFALEINDRFVETYEAGGLCVGGSFQEHLDTNFCTKNVNFKVLANQV